MAYGKKDGSGAGRGRKGGGRRNANTGPCSKGGVGAGKGGGQGKGTGRTALKMLVALVLMGMLTGCGFLREQVQPRVREGLLRLDMEVQMVRATGEALVEAPETVSEADKEQFLDRLKLVNDITYVLNILVGNYDLSGLLTLEARDDGPGTDMVLE